jgi:hypothetical protein
MDINHLSDDEVALAARALSIHRASLRRKLDRLTPGSSEHTQTLAEIRITQHVVTKLNSVDLQRVSAA